MSKDTIAVTFDGRSLVPADAWAAEQMSKLSKDVRLNAHLTKAKGTHDVRASLNSIYWAGLGLMVENFDEQDAQRWPTSRKLHTLLLETQGYVDRLWRIDGTYRIVPDSVAYDNMSDEDFSSYVEKARAFLVTHWGWDPLTQWVENKKAEAAARMRAGR